MLGWTQKEAGDVFGVTQQGVDKLTTKLQTQISSIQNSYYKDKKTIEQIKDFYHVDETTT